MMKTNPAYMPRQISTQLQPTQQFSMKGSKMPPNDTEALLEAYTSPLEASRNLRKETSSTLTSVSKASLNASQSPPSPLRNLFLGHTGKIDLIGSLRFHHRIHDNNWCRGAVLEAQGELDTEFGGMLD